MDRAERGYSLIEVVISVALLSTILGIAYTTLNLGQKTSNSTLSAIDLEDKLESVLVQLSEEVRWAGRQIEDVNDNGTLDDGEDVNGNGRLDDDWAVATSQLTYNVRKASGGYSLPITYRLNGDVLERVVMTNPDGSVTVTPVAKGVTLFAVTDTDPVLKVTLSLSYRNPDGTVATRSQTISVTPRN